MASYAAVLQNTLNFSLVPSALYFSLKRRKNRKNFRLRLRRAENGHFFARRAENVLTFLSVGGFAPLWKNFCGRPCVVVDDFCLYRSVRYIIMHVDVYCIHFADRSHGSVVVRLLLSSLKDAALKHKGATRHVACSLSERLRQFHNM